ncbi:protein kinase domain-containing protein [Reyranella sp.]|uniref:protein kinase domain-containing protein n=1 Tax=Reyranella sp. TaxID=1929291 RepID=UPI003D0A1EC9
MSEDQAEREVQARAELRGVLPAGTKLRGYELTSVLGQGAFGITYRAVDATLHREVAIKEYLPATLALREGRTTVLPRSPDHAQQFAWGRDRFLEEARTLARLERAPGIVRVYDFLEDNGTAYMVMALIEGETLARRLTREHRLTPGAVDHLLYPLLEGLEEFHAATFLHRDIKPANIMVDAGGRPTLIDFGASRAAMAERSTTMTAIFTPGYAAAEQFIAASKLGPATDIYGLSATLYHAISGQIPPSAIERVMKDDYEALETLQPEGFAPALLRGIDGGLALRATDRPQSIGEWREMLGTVSRGLYTTQIARKPKRVAGRAGRPRLTLKGPALWASLAAAIVLLGGAGYLAWINSGTTATTAALNLSAEQLEQALAERRKADAFAAEKRRLVEEAQRRAAAEAEANRQAEKELQDARLARQNAEAELARLKADFEAREAQRAASAGGAEPANVVAQKTFEEAAQRKAEAEAAALREAESEAQRKAAAEAESTRLADEALARAQAEQQQAEAEARRKAEVEAAKRKADEEALQKAEAAAKQKGDAEAQKKVAEAAERALRLEPADRERLQVALTSLGFDTRGRDGILGPRSREMIAAWQKARNQPETGFLTATQQQALLKEAAPAVGKFDDELKQATEEKRLAAATPPQTVAAIPAAMTTTAADGLWRGTYACAPPGPALSINLEVRIANGVGYWPAPNTGIANDNTVGIRVSVGKDRVTAVRTRVQSSVVGVGTLSGALDGNSIRATGNEYAGRDRICTLALTRVPETAPADSSYDGAYAGDANYGGYSGSAGRVFVKLDIANGRGAGTMTSPGCSPSPFSVSISPAGTVSGEGNFNCLVGGNSEISGRLQISGRHDGNSILLTLTSQRGSFRSMRLARQPN